MEAALKRISALAALVASCVWTIGCGGQKPPPPPAPEPTAEASSTPEAKEDPEPAPSPKKSAKEVLLGEGASFGLSYVDSSEWKKMVNEACGKKTKSKEKKLECMVEVETAAGDEGLRFEKTGDKLWLVFFGKDKGKDVTLHKLQVTIESDDASKVVLKPQGKDAGEGKRTWKKLPDTIPIEVSEEQTLRVPDPDRGTLVYKPR